MKTKLDSRNAVIDIEKCVDNVGSRYGLVVVASQIARDLRRKNNNPDKLITCIDALLEIQNSNVDVVSAIKKIR